MFAAGETVVRRRAPLVTDPYSTQASEADWAHAADYPICGCGVAGSGSQEPLQTARGPVESDFDIYAPAGTDIAATDRLIVRGLICEVVGRPFDWANPFTGWKPGLVVQAKIVEG